jgi:methylase of polypeptide subunit release factors
MKTKNGTWFKNHSHSWIIIILASALAIVAFYSWFTLPAYPVVELVKGGTGTVLDAGCGSGRTVISLGKATSELKIVGFDRFDAA